MSKGKTYPSETQEYIQEETGVRVRRLTGGDADNCHIYFTANEFTADGQHIVFFSTRSGSAQLHLLNLTDGTMVQLTDTEGLRSLSACVHPREPVAYYVAGRELRSVRLDTLEEAALYRCPDGCALALPTITADGSHVAIAYSETVAVSTETGVIYSSMAERYFRHPASVVIRVETASGKALACWGETAWISHVCIHPLDPDCILFCHEGGGNVHQRMWVVRVGQRPAVPRPLWVQREGDFAVHEFFTRQGDVGFQCTQQSAGQALQFDAYIRPDGTWLRQFRHPGPQRPGHIQSNRDGAWAVGDGAFVTAPDPDGRKWIGINEYVAGTVRVRRLCRHDTSWRTQISHPHPALSPDDRWVVFTSDRGGKCNVYMAEVPRAQPA